MKPEYTELLHRYKPIKANDNLQSLVNPAGAADKD